MAISSPDVSAQIPTRIRIDTLPPQEQPPLPMTASTMERISHPWMPERLRTIIDVKEGQITQEISRLSRSLTNLTAREQIHYDREGRKNIIDRLLGRNELVNSLREAQQQEASARFNYQKAEKLKEAFAHRYPGLKDGKVEQYKHYTEVKPREAQIEGKIKSLQEAETQIIDWLASQTNGKPDKMRDAARRLKENKTQQAQLTSELQTVREVIQRSQLSSDEVKIVEEYLRRIRLAQDAKREWEGDLKVKGSDQERTHVRLEDIPAEKRDQYKGRVDNQGFVLKSNGERIEIKNPAVFHGAKGEVELAKRRLEAWQKRKQEIKNYPKEAEEIETQVDDLQSTGTALTEYKTRYVDKVDSNQEEIGRLTDEKQVLTRIVDDYKRRLEAANKQLVWETGQPIESVEKIQQEVKYLKVQISAFESKTTEDDNNIRRLDHDVKLAVNPSLLVAEPSTNPSLKKAIELVTKDEPIQNPSTLRPVEKANIRISTVVLGQKVLDKHPELKAVINEPLRNANEAVVAKMEENRISSLPLKELVKRPAQDIASLISEGKLTIDQIKKYQLNNKFDRIHGTMTSVDGQPVTQDPVLLEATLKAEFNGKDLKNEVLPQLYVESIRKALSLLNSGDIQNLSAEQKLDIDRLIETINKTKTTNPPKEIEQRLNQALNLLMLANSTKAIMNKPVS